MMGAMAKRCNSANRKGVEKNEAERWMGGGDIDRRSRKREDGSEGRWRRLRWQRRWREEDAEGSYLLLMAVRVSEGWRAIQL